MKLSDVEWNDLTTRLRPVTVSDEEIEEVILDVTNGGINARTSIPSSYSDINSETNIDEATENEEIFLFDDLGIDIKNKILKLLDSAFTKTPINSSVDLVRCIAHEDELRVVCSITHRLNSDECSAFDELAVACVENRDLEHESQLAYGTIDSFWRASHESEKFDGWNFDGTLYKYTDEPYKLWSGPKDMDEWAKFAADSEAMESVLTEREKHVVHFHPMAKGIDSTNSYVKWFKKMDNISSQQFDVSDRVTKVNLSEISVDKSSVVFRNTIIL